MRRWGRTAFGRMLVSGQRRPSKRTFFMTGNGGQRTPWTATVTSPSSPQPCWNLLIWSCQRPRPLWLVMVSWSSLTRTWEMCLGYLLGVGKWFSWSRHISYEEVKKHRDLPFMTKVSLVAKACPNPQNMTNFYLSTSYVVYSQQFDCTLYSTVRSMINLQWILSF